MKRILIVNDHLGFSGGVDAIIRVELSGLEKAGFEVTLLGIKGSDIDAKDGYFIMKYEQNRVKAKIDKFLGSYNIYKKIKDTIDILKPDIVRIHLISEYPSEVYKALERYRSVQILHGPNLFCASSWGNKKRTGEDCSLGIGIKCFKDGCVSLPVAIAYCILNNRIWNKVKNNIRIFQSPSLFLKMKAEALGLKPIVCIPNCMGEEFVSEQPNYKNKGNVITYVGALAESKGIFYLPDMLLKVKKEYSDITLIICGRGKGEQKLIQEFKLRKLEKNVRFLGFINNKEIARIYRMSRVLVMPSIWAEIFAVVAIEGLACGVPIVATAVGGLPEIVKDKECGYLVEPRNSEALADAVIGLLKDEKKRIQMAINAREYAIQNFHPDIYIKKVLEITSNI